MSIDVKYVVTVISISCPFRTAIKPHNKETKEIVFVDILHRKYIFVQEIGIMNTLQDRKTKLLSKLLQVRVKIFHMCHKEESNCPLLRHFFCVEAV